MTFDTLKEKSGGGRGKKEKLAKKSPIWSEGKLWNQFPAGWRLLYGGFHDVGVSVEWHDLDAGSELEWSRSFHAESLELCLNLTGDGVVRSERGCMDFEPLIAGFYVSSGDALRASRQPGRHRFITVEFSAPFLRSQLSRCDGALDPVVEGFVQGRKERDRLSATHRLTTAQEQWVAQTLHPPVAQGARPIWYQSKVLGLMAEFFFERQGPDELFCDRQKRLARDRVDRVIAILSKRLAEPPTLDEIAREIGCSPFHLSRTFSGETGVTIPQYIRKLRIERAAELLRSGKYNVTEAAMEVGYSSLSHFSQAFCQTMGCCPVLYPLRK